MSGSCTITWLGEGGLILLYQAKSKTEILSHRNHLNPLRTKLLKPQTIETTLEVLRSIKGQAATECARYGRNFAMAPGDFLHASDIMGRDVHEIKSKSRPKLTPCLHFKVAMLFLQRFSPGSSRHTLFAYNSVLGIIEKSRSLDVGRPHGRTTPYSIINGMYALCMHACLPKIFHIIYYIPCTDI